MEQITVSGLVRRGKQMGRKLGFPTANIAMPGNAQLPSNGVYVGVATLEDESTWPCVLNQGNHPTLPEGGASIEAHLLDYEGDLYGCCISLTYLSKLRDERRFESVDALRAQVERDKKAARRWFVENQPK